MDLQASEFDRLLFFEHTRKASEATYASNPLDADVRAANVFSLTLRRFRFGVSFLMNANAFVSESDEMGWCSARAIAVSERFRVYEDGGG